jgi:hypothetical protein
MAQTFEEWWANWNTDNFRLFGKDSSMNAAWDAATYAASSIPAQSGQQHGDRTDEFKRGITFAKGALKRAVTERGEFGYQFLDEYLGGNDEIPMSEVRRSTGGNLSQSQERLSPTLAEGQNSAELVEKTAANTRAGDALERNWTVEAGALATNSLPEALREIEKEKP